MAGANIKSLDQAIDELMKNYEIALKEAVEYASDRAVEDIWKYSMTCLEEYYDNYIPTRYERTDSLHYAILPYLTIKNNSKDIVVTAGVEYNPSVLEAYISNSDVYWGSNQYGQADAYWVIDNYLRGVHPATDGGSVAGEAFYYENIDAQSPTEKMKNYLDQYATTFSDNILISFAKQVVKMR